MSPPLGRFTRLIRGRDQRAVSVKENFSCLPLRGRIRRNGQTEPECPRARNTFEGGNGIATRVGDHSFRLSSRFSHQQFNTLASTYPEGMFQFDPGYTSLPGIVNTGASFASFLLGAAGRAKRAWCNPPRTSERIGTTWPRATPGNSAKDSTIIRIAQSRSDHALAWRSMTGSPMSTSTRRTR